MLRNSVRNLLIHQRIEMTLARAKEVRRLAERVITLGKADTVVARRRAYAVLPDRDLIMRLFKDIAPLFKARQGGYTRIIPLGFRRGDGAHLAILELTEKKIDEKTAKKKKEKAKEEKPAAGKAHGAKAQAGAAEEAAGHETAHEAAGRKEASHAKKDESKIKSVPKSKPTLEEEKKTERAKAEDQKLDGKKGFVKNLRGFFRRKSDM